MAGTTSRLSAPGSPGIGISLPGPHTALLLERRGGSGAEYFAICRRFPTPDRLRSGRRRCRSTPSPTATSAPTLSASKPRLAMVYRRRPVLVEQQEVDVAVPEQLGRARRGWSRRARRDRRSGRCRRVSSASAAPARARAGPATSTGRSSASCSGGARVTSIDSSTRKMSAARSRNTSCMPVSAAMASTSVRSRSNTCPRRSVRSYTSDSRYSSYGDGIDQQQAGPRVARPGCAPSST